MYNRRDSGIVVGMEICSGIVLGMKIGRRWYVMLCAPAADMEEGTKIGRSNRRVAVAVQKLR